MKNHFKNVKNAVRSARYAQNYVKSQKNAEDILWG